MITRVYLDREPGLGAWVQCLLYLVHERAVRCVCNVQRQ